MVRTGDMDWLQRMDEHDQRRAKRDNHRLIEESGEEDAGPLEVAGSHISLGRPRGDAGRRGTSRPPGPVGYSCSMRWSRRSSAVLVAGVLALAACGSSDPPGSGEAPPASSPVPPAPVEVIGVYDGVGFYPACGNEQLLHDDVRWYTLANTAYPPIDEQLHAVLDEVLAVDREPMPSGPQGITRVVEPGPGDDVGTLVVWSDGVARWVSDSGLLDVWLVKSPLRYNWVC